MHKQSTVLSMFNFFVIMVAIKRTCLLFKQLLNAAEIIFGDYKYFEFHLRQTRIKAMYVKLI